MMLIFDFKYVWNLIDVRLYWWFVEMKEWRREWDNALFMLKLLFSQVVRALSSLVTL